MNSVLLEKASGPFSQWQKELIFEKKIHGKWRRADREVKQRIEGCQRELADEVSSGPGALAAYLRRQLELTEADRIDAPPVPRRQLTAAEYRQPPIELERELGEAWRDIVSPKWASQPLFWLLCHIEWIAQGRLGKTGYALRECLMGGSRKRADTSKREAQTRSFLRRTGGLFRARGNVSVFSDCPMARAWWRFRLAQQATSHAENGDAGHLSLDDAHRALHYSDPAWEQLVMLSLRRIVVINQQRARAAIISHLCNLLANGGRPTKQHIQGIAQILARRGLRRSLDYTPWAEMEVTSDDLI